VPSLCCFVLAVAEEFRRATTAAHRYEQLKRMAHARDEPGLDAARRVYLEFYSHAPPDSPHGSGLRAVLHVPRKTARRVILTITKGIDAARLAAARQAA